MLITLRCENNSNMEGVLLAMGDDRIRVAVRRLNDTVEFRQIDGVWFGEQGNAVEIESLLFPVSQTASLKVRHA
jgi:hypothetical protein